MGKKIDEKFKGNLFDFNNLKDQLQVEFLASSGRGHRDADVSFLLTYNGNLIGQLGFSFGLRFYYLIDKYPKSELNKNPYCKALEIVKNKVIITNINSEKGTGEIRKNFNFRDYLMKYFNKKLKREKVVYLLPADLNYWMIPSVVQERIKRKLPTSTLEYLIMNYDRVAKRNGFNYNSDIGLFERKQ
jgi:hypothetical protein